MEGNRGSTTMDDQLVRKVGRYRALRDARISVRLKINAAGFLAAIFLVLLRTL